MRTLSLMDVATVLETSGEKIENYAEIYNTSKPIAEKLLFRQTYEGMIEEIEKKGVFKAVEKEQIKFDIDTSKSDKI